MMATVQAMDISPPKGIDVHHRNDVHLRSASIPHNRPNYGPLTNVNEDGCFESDRVIKSGYVEKRTKTKNWKTVYIVLRPKSLSMYKNEKETKLRSKVHLSDLTAVTFLKDPKHKRDNVFGLFSPSRNFHLQAPTKRDAQEWVDLIRKDARIDEEEEEMFLSGPLAQSPSPGGLMTLATSGPRDISRGPDTDGVLSSSPEPYGPPEPRFSRRHQRRESSIFDSSGMSGNELPSQSEMSDSELHRPNDTTSNAAAMGNRSGSQVSITNLVGQGNNGAAAGQDLDRVIWQGWLWLLRSKSGVKQWKKMWGVLRPRNLILYKDESEYAAQWIVELSIVVDVVDTDPVSKKKKNCLQVITEEKSYRFCTRDEESLVQFIGALKSLLVKRRGSKLG